MSIIGVRPAARLVDRYFFSRFVQFVMMVSDGGSTAWVGSSIRNRWPSRVTTYWSTLFAGCPMPVLNSGRGVPSAM